LKKRIFNSDAILVKRLRKDDKVAFELIFNNFKDKLYYFTLGYLHLKTETEEIVQNVFVSLWENRDKLNEDLPVQNFLYKITVNHIYNYFRHQLVRQKYTEHIAAEQLIDDHNTELSIMANELERVVNTFVGELSSRQQAIYRMSRIEGLCHAEIARRLGLSVRSVENQIYRTLKYIRETLKAESLLTE
jgi:RNA polymerase sigma-70 factor (ECF subfamily)